MSKRNFPAPSRNDQITNQPTNQGRPGISLCLCGGYRDSLSASALAGVVGYTQINLSQGAGGQFVNSPVKGPPFTEIASDAQRIQYPPTQFISCSINRLERGVTKP